MRAVLLTAQGGPEVLELTEVPVPQRKTGEVLIKVEAAAVPFYEIQLRSGLLPVGELPSVFGHEAAGEIVEADDAALVGKRVVVMTMGGAYAEFLAVPPESVTPIPDGLTTAEAVAAAVPASVAHVLLEVANLAEGETILVEAAGGAIGGYLAQFAADHRARVVATAGAGKADTVKHLRADVVLDHSDPTWRSQVPDGIDVVFSSIGGPETTELLDKMTPCRGRMLVYGLLSGSLPPITVADLMPRGLTVTAVAGASAYAGAVHAARPIALARVAGGMLPSIDRTYPLADVVEAHRRVESREGSGKVVLTLS